MQSRILSQLRLLKIYAAAMTLTFTALCLTALTPSAQKKQKFQEIDAERINIVDAHGSPQLVVSNKDRFPEPMANGKELKGMRSVRPAGLVFYDATGTEAGGLATFQTQSGKNSVVAFDYATTEAVGFSRFESDDGNKYSAGFEVLDPPPPGTTIEEAAAKHRTRIAIQNENKDAQITLADADGKQRIKLKVAADGSASIQILDPDGKVVFSAPKSE